MQKTNFKDREKILFSNRSELRKWLKDNHDKSDGIWLIIYKKDSETKSITHLDAVKEGLCFGWIDSVQKKYDEESTIQYFSPRKKGSSWSAVNKEFIKELVKENLMTEAGLVKINKAKEDGSWTFYDSINNLEIPNDLEEVFAKNKKSKEAFNKLSNSNKKFLLAWIKTAKRDETRKDRIEKIAKTGGKDLL